MSTAAWVKVPSGTQEGHLQRFLLGEAGRHDFAKQTDDFLVAQRSLVALERHAQHFGLALRPIVVHGLARSRLGYAHQLGEARAFIQQSMNARVDGIDAVANIAQTRARRRRRRNFDLGFRVDLRLRLIFGFALSLPRFMGGGARTRA